jgi:hypothetical protein
MQQNWMLALAGLTREGLAMLIAPSQSLGPNEANQPNLFFLFDCCLIAV